jgi:hypothetical protein
MPHFPANPLEQLAVQAGAAEATLDLTGLSPEAAMSALETLLSGERVANSYRVCFDPPAGDGRETLFQPIGRRLLQARREGILQTCLPVDGAAYFIAFPDR